MIKNRTRFIERFSIVCTLNLLFFLIIFGTPVRGQDESIEIRSDLVLIPTTVLNREARYLTNLKKEDFRIFENGVEQKIDLFETAHYPVTILLLLDRSGSMDGHRQILAKAATSFVRQMRNDDKIIAATFADDVDEIVSKRKVSEFREIITIKNRANDHTTRVYEAVNYGFHELRKTRGRKAIILFSDGLSEQTFFASAKKSLREAEEQEAMVYTVRFDTSMQFASTMSNKALHRTLKLYDDAGKYLKALSAATGGRSFRIEEMGDLGTTFGEVAKELSQQYSLGYYPTDSGKNGERRTIKVEVNVPNAVVRARREVIFKKSN